MVEEIIIEMSGRGFDLELGPHQGLLGFYARFFVTDPTGEDDDERYDAEWANCGHGISVLEALQMAQQLTLGQFSGQVPEYTEFLP